MPNCIVRAVATASAFVVLGLGGAIGCGPQQPVRPPDVAPAEEQREPQPAEPASEPAPVSPSTAPIPEPPPVDPPADAPPARIVGQVVFSGTPEVATTINVSSDAYFAWKNPDGIPDPKYLVNADRTLPNVIVWIEHAAVDVARYPVPSEPAVLVLDERANYRPHVLPMRDGQALRLSNEADHCMCPQVRRRRGSVSEFTIHSRKSAELVMHAEEKPIPITEPHLSWISAFVQVFPHPWYGASDDTGNFEIADVPPGTHTLHAWHEKYGKAEVPVTLAPGARVEVRLQLGP